jgi:hypothetical protein
VVERPVLLHEHDNVFDVPSRRQGAEGAGGGDPAEEAAAGEPVRVGHHGSLQGTSAGNVQPRWLKLFENTDLRT